MNISLDGKRALVTGGNSGIGAAIVNALGEGGGAEHFTWSGLIADMLDGGTETPHV